LFAATKRAAKKARRVKLVVCPPAVYLPFFKKGENLALGGQDSFTADEGAYTGQISPAMLQHVGAEYVIVGHSERRARGETDEEISRKVKLAIRHGLYGILCVGERERDDGHRYLKLLRDQFVTAVSQIPKTMFNRLILAYEPVWAIGAGAKASDTPGGFLEQKIFLRKILNEILPKKQAMEIPILYGGSVNDDNASGFLDQGEADGLLVGRASLYPQVFKSILEQAAKLK